MRPTTLALIVGCGMLAAGGLAALSAALLRPPVQLSDALDRVAGERPRSGVASPDLGSDRLGAWAYGVLRLPLSATQLQALHLRGLSISAFYTEKVVWALMGLVAPGVLAAVVAVRGAVHLPRPHHARTPGEPIGHPVAPRRRRGLRRGPLPSDP